MNKEIKKLQDKAREEWSIYIHPEDADMFDRDIDTDRFENYLDTLIEQTHKQGYEKGFIDGTGLTGRIAEEEIAELKEKWSKKKKCKRCIAGTLGGCIICGKK